MILSGEINLLILQWWVYYHLVCERQVVDKMNIISKVGGVFPGIKLFVY